MNRYGCKWILLFLSAIMSVTLTGCGYSEEEKAQMQEYENQASENAVSYISEKYGFQADILDAECETVDVVAVPDFSPSATGVVRVRMEYDGHEFLVKIAGDEVTTDGSDTYQLEQIQQAILEKMNALTGFSVREMHVAYGRYWNPVMDLSDSGLVHTYYDGSNLSEVLSEKGCRMVCSGVGVDLSMIDVEELKELVGDREVLFVSYRSEDDFENAGNRDYHLGGGTRIVYGIDDNALYIDEYRIIGGNNEEYVEYDLREQDGIYYIPDDRDAQVVLTETVLDDVSNWNGRGYVNAKQVLDTAYAITSESKEIYFFIPVDLLEDAGSADNVGMIVYQYEEDDVTKYNHAVTSVSDDGRYLIGTIYMKDYSELKISVLRDMGE